MVTYKEFSYSEYFKTELPAHWQEKRLGFLSMQTKNAFVDGPFGSDLKSDDYLDEGVPLIQLNNIRDGKHILRNMKFISDNKKKDLIRHLALPQDIVIAKMADPVARSAVVSGEFKEYVIVADCVKLTPNLKLVDLNFLIWAINSDCVRENAELVSTGTTRIRINLGELKKLKVPYPSLSEQIQICTFLDHETAKIDSLIEKQQQLIQLLKEKRQAVISHAVTKGLNPNVPMKDSGVEWLGQVPEHWDIKKIKYLGSILNGYAFPSDGFTEEGVRVLKISNIQNMYLDWSDLSFVSEILAKTLAQFSIKKGDLVFALTRPIISSGIKAAIIDIDEKILLNQRNAILRPNELCSRKWLYYMILNGSFVQEFNNQIDKTGQQPNISTTAIGNLAIPVAPIKEQNSIVEYIESKLKVIDRLILKAESAIQLMQERRTALISAVVTGKIDVRNWQNPNNNNKAKTEFSA